MTNECPEKLILPITHLPNTLRDLFANWHTYDQELCEHYYSEIDWILSLMGEYEEDPRVKKAMVELIAMGDEIERVLGFRPEHLWYGLKPSNDLDRLSAHDKTEIECFKTYLNFVGTLKNDGLRHSDATSIAYVEIYGKTK